MALISFILFIFTAIGCGGGDGSPEVGNNNPNRSAACSAMDRATCIQNNPRCGWGDGACWVQNNDDDDENDDGEVECSDVTDKAKCVAASNCEWTDENKCDWP